MRSVDWLNTTASQVPRPARASGRDPVSAQIGRTPLLDLTGLARLAPGVRLLAKAEWTNPGGSVKDRPALAIVQAAEARGLLGPGRTLIDSTSGNMGIAYALLGAARGFRVKLVVPGNVGGARLALMRRYGAEVVCSDPLAGSDGAIEHVRALVAAAPGRYFYADQYNNPANWQAHYRTTAPEIWAQTGGRATHFVAGLGTSGTFVGTTRRLRELAARGGGLPLTAIAFQPDAPFHGLEGLKHMPSAIVPGIYDPSLADDLRAASTEEAHALARRLARAHGLLVGVSAAAAIGVALAVARELEAGTVVTVLPDSGVKYLHERFWDESG